LATPQPQRHLQLPREADLPPLVILGRLQLTPHQVPLHLNEPAPPVDVTPLKGEELAGAHSDA